MSQQTRESRVAEWAELIGASVPDSVRDDVEEPPYVDQPTDRHS